MSMFEIHGGFTGLAASSRVRLARNIKGYPFRLTEQQHSEIADKVFAALKENPTIGPEFDKKQIIPRSTEASQLVEEHLISPELAQNGGWLIVSKDSGRVHHGRRGRSPAFAGHRHRSLPEGMSRNRKPCSFAHRSGAAVRV